MRHPDTAFPRTRQAGGTITMLPGVLWPWRSGQAEKMELSEAGRLPFPTVSHLNVDSVMKIQ